MKNKKPWSGTVGFRILSTVARKLGKNHVGNHPFQPPAR